MMIFDVVEQEVDTEQLEAIESLSKNMRLEITSNRRDLNWSSVLFLSGSISTVSCFHSHTLTITIFVYTHYLVNHFLL